MSTRAAPESLAQYRRALELLRAQRGAEAIGATILAVNADPAAPEPAQLFVKLLQQFTLGAAEPVAAALTACLARDDLHHQPLIRSALNCLVATPAFQRLRDHAARAGWESAVAALAAGPAASFLASPLLRGVLRRGICHDIAFERFLIALRRHLLALRSAPPPWWLDLAAALALQAAHNEYAWPVGPTQDSIVAALLRTDAPLSLHTALAIAMYRPLPAAFAARSDSAAIREIVAAALPDAEEVARRATIPSLRPRSDAATRQVADQYEENPYPRWLSFDKPEPGERLAALRRHLPQGATQDFTGPLDVLIAGCGTGRQALAAAIGYGALARVLALDLSAASLAYAARMAQRYSIANIDFLQADLRDIAHLDRHFDVIEAVGVLHHIADPVAAWRELAAQLKPGGMMKIGLYSERARRAIVAARAEIARLRLADDKAGIHELRRRVLEAPEAPADWRHALPRFTDFFTLSGCRDLVFHRLEHRFSPASIAAALGAVGLAFRGFELPARILAQFQARHPAPGAVLDLALWEAFEADHPDIFAGMCRFWAHKPAI